MKKVLSLVLVIAMVLSSMSFAFAGTFKDIADTDYAKAIETLTALGIVTGYEDGTYRPEKVVTRAEMAKLMVEILGYGDLVAGSKSQFTDTQGHWADAWIALAAGKAIVLGDGNGKFRPDATVSYDEAITMVVRALGYTDASNELKIASWPTNFKIKAAELGLTDDVKLSTTGADRGGVAQLLYNALTATLVTVNSDGDVVKSTTQTTDRDGKVVVTYTELLSRIATLDTNYDVDTNTLDKDSKYYGGNKVDLAPYMYQNLDVYLNADDEVVFVKGTNSVIVEGKVTDVAKDGDVLYVLVENANEKEFKVEVTEDVTVYYNGEEGTIDNVEETLEAKLLTNVGAQVTVIVDDSEDGTGNDNGKVDKYEDVVAMVAEKASFGVLVEEDYEEGDLKIYGVNNNIALPNSDGDVSLSKVTVTGAVDELEEIKENDVVVAYFALDNSPVKLVVTRDSVEGKVTRTNTAEDTIYIDGTKYEVSDVLYNLGTKEVGSEGTFYFDNYGKVFAFDGKENAPTDYAVVLGVENGEATEKFNSASVKTYPEIKLATQDGEEVVYKVFVELTIDDNETPNNSADDFIAIDDTATVTSKDVDDLDGKLVKVENTDELNLQVVAANQLIKYSVDEDGYIDAIEVVKAGVNTGSNATIKVADLDVMTSEDTVVFDSSDDFAVVDVDSVKAGAAWVFYGDSDKAEVIVTSNVASANDGTYGVITAVNYALNSSNKKVQEVTALIDGEEVVFLTNSTTTTDALDITTGQAIKFTVNGSDVITAVDYASSGDGFVAYKDLTITELTRTRLNNMFFSADCVVYIYDVSAEEWTVGSIGDLSDDTDVVKMTSAYVLDSTDSSAIGIVVQVVK